jgi:squalene/oxidosqualene cyclase-like protein
LSRGPLADRAGAVLNPAAARLIALQHADGHWEGEVVWCTMILSQYIIVRHVTGRPVAEDDRERMLRHYHVTRTADGGWPLHPEGPAQLFTTTLAYVALRLLGVPPDEDITAAARAWLRRQGSAVLGIPTWGKFWLSVLNLYGRDGVGAFPPELFLLPAWMPGHPRGWYCHTRYIYLAISYLSGLRFRADLGPLREALRHELYDKPYESIDFAAHRDDVAPTDLYARPAFPLNMLRRAIPLVMRAVPASLHDRALRICFDRILYEQRVTQYQALSPVNGLLNCLAIHATNPSHPDLEPSLAGLEAWRWCDEHGGIRFAGARSQVWDTAFAVRALLQAPLMVPPVEESLRRAHAYLKQAQIVEELPGRDEQDRESIRGGWCFSDGAHRWPVSDCAAEALTAMLELEQVQGLIAASDRLPPKRVQAALTFIIARQNADGGFSTYEPARAGTWLDRLNPSEMFRDCMTDRSYVECTASAVEVLATVKRLRPDWFTADAAIAFDRGLGFLRCSQREDGTFPSGWGINFTYSIFHAVKALRAAGVTRHDPVLTRAAGWLSGTQRADGGWGEHFTGCLEGRYVEHPRSQAVQTAWALLALGEIDPASDAIGTGMTWLLSAQRADGSWPRDAVNGVFFGTAMLEYALYSAYFPVWALATYVRERS